MDMAKELERAGQVDGETDVKSSSSSSSESDGLTTASTAKKRALESKQTSPMKKKKKKKETDDEGEEDEEEKEGEAEEEDSSEEEQEGEEEKEQDENENEEDEAEVEDKEVKKPATDKFKINRIWTEEDEIQLLTSCIHYREKTGMDPLSPGSRRHFLTTIVESFHYRFKRKQFTNKFRRFKKMYLETTPKRKNLSPHETHIFSLSKKIWGTSTSIANQTSSKQQQSQPLPSFSFSGYSYLGKSSVQMGHDAAYVRAGLELLPEETRSYLDHKWKALHLELSKLIIKKSELALEEARTILAAFESSVENN